MACGCSRKARTASGAPVNYVYELTPASGGETKTYLTMLEANRERRRMGGGTIRNVPAPKATPISA